VLGSGVDSVWSHKAYAEKYGIKYCSLAIFILVGGEREVRACTWQDKGITAGDRHCEQSRKSGLGFKNYDIPVVPDLKEVAAALGQVKAATA